MSIQEGLDADRAGRVEVAAALYEEALATEDSEQIFVNLIVLYWQATDFGLAAAKKLSREFMAKAGRRIRELLAEGEGRFPASSEVRFWRRYIAWADLGEPFGERACQELLREDPATLVPAMHLFAISNGGQAREEAEALLRRCRVDGTTRARYVSSVVEAVMRRSDHRR